eukprot:TRINITY_DN29725_c0_g1_i1.p1 TRINITY_DN29725_c0_g1~~TRINITY_DN29725_c0_g1_i1.p1  ORF type:complete len:841 (-),score=224.52 TRINITY_DN29725_c0_g1_i1:485-2884(-)
MGSSTSLEEELPEGADDLRTEHNGAEAGSTLTAVQQTGEFSLKAGSEVQHQPSSSSSSLRQSQEQHLRQPWKDEAWSFQEFGRLWERHVPGGRSQAASRPLVRQILLRALVPDAGVSTWSASRVDHCLGDYLRSVGASVSFLEACSVLRAVVQNQSAALGGAAAPATSAAGETKSTSVFSSLSEASSRRTESGSPQRLLAKPLLFGDHLGVPQPRGARKADPEPLSRVQPGTTGHHLGGQTAANPHEVDSEPMRPTRASLESECSRLQARLGALQAVYERYVLKSESLRRALVDGYADMCGNGTDAGRAGEDAGSVVSLHRQLNSKRMAVVTLEAELQRYTDRLRYSMVVAERQKRDRGGLRDDTVLQAKKKQAAHSRLQEEATKLENMEQELDELSRRCKTEELRAAMLREAFEQEQSRVGESLGRAEAFVSDLVAATEDTRKFEVEEQAMSRECIQALSHIRAERAEDEAVVEGRASTLRSELEESQRYLQLKSGSGAAAANAVGGQDRAEAQKHAAHNELLHMRERYEAAMLSAQTWSQEALDLKWRFNHLRRKDEETREEIQQLLGGGQLSVEDRLLLLRQLLATAEAEEVRLLLAQARVAEETAIMKARKSPDAVPDWQHLAAGRLAAADSDSEALAQLHVRSLGEALAELRSSSFPDLAAAETEDAVTSGVDADVAALTSQLGRALAMRGRHDCEIQEMRLYLRHIQEGNSSLNAALQEASARPPSSTNDAGSPLLVSPPSLASPALARRDARQDGEVDVHANALRQCAAALRRTEATLRALGSQRPQHEDPS